jgi:hypothetical protein
VKTLSPAAAKLLRQLRGESVEVWDTRKTLQANRRGYLRVVKDRLTLTELGSQVAEALGD